jgi:hypothetical protein
MNTWAVLATRPARLTAGVSFTVIPVLGAGSLGWFALGMLLACACLGRLQAPWPGMSGIGRSARVSHVGATWRRAYRLLLATFWSGHGLQQSDAPHAWPPVGKAPGQAVSQAARPFFAAPVEPSNTAEPGRDQGAAIAVLASWGRTDYGTPDPAGPATGAQAAGWPAASRPAASRLGTSEPGASRLGTSRPGTIEPYGDQLGLGASAWAAASGQHAAPGRPQTRRRRSEDSRLYQRAVPIGPTGITPPAGAGSGSEPAIRKRSGLRRRIDGMLVEILKDESDECQQPSRGEPDEGFWGPDARSGGQPVTGGYRSKHRLNDPASEPSQTDRAGRSRRPPRHAAPPASFSARLTSRYAAS